MSNAIYRNPDQPAQFWTGHGLRPRWLVFQLAAGRRLDDFKLGPLAMAAESRPKNYAELSAQERWDIDKTLGILDWDGDPKK